MKSCTIFGLSFFLFYVLSIRLLRRFVLLYNFFGNCRPLMIWMKLLKQFLG